MDLKDVERWIKNFNKKGFMSIVLCNSLVVFHNLHSDSPKDVRFKVKTSHYNGLWGLGTSLNYKFLFLYLHAKKSSH